MEEKKRLLVVDDEETICRLLELNLQIAGYEVDTASSAEEVLRLPPDRLASYSLVLLDVMMGDMDGFELAERLRKSPGTAATPIIFCTARNEADDEIRGLEIGGEDYITKPFAMRTLLARVKKVLGRAPAPGAGVMRHKGIVMDDPAKTLHVDGVPVALTPNEWGLLAMLVAHPGRVFSRAELLEGVRGPGIVVVDRAIDVNIVHLRRKLGPYGRCIVTRPGWGYTLVSD